MNIVNLDYSRALRFAKAQSNKTSREIINEQGISTSTLAAIAANERKPSTDVIERICLATEVKVSDFMKWAEGE